MWNRRAEEISQMDKLLDMARRSCAMKHHEVLTLSLESPIRPKVEEFLS
jgi:hypothetical protein